MKIASSTTLFGIVLAVSMFGAGIVADKLTNVYITNLPLDEQGNLKTATTHVNNTMLVFNQTVTIPSSTSDYHYLASFNTDGFRNFYIMAKAELGSFQTGANVHVNFFENSFGIRTPPEPTGGYFNLETQSVTAPHGCSGKSGMIGVHSPTVDLYLMIYNSNIGFDGLLTIAVYLTD